MVYVIKVCWQLASSVHCQKFFTVHTAMIYVIKVCWQLASSVHCQEFFTIHTETVYVIQVCWQLASCMTYTTAVSTVKTPDDEQRNCTNHVEFYTKNKFEKLVHLVGFIIRTRIDLWSMLSPCWRLTESDHNVGSKSDAQTYMSAMHFYICIR